jgi:predicted alpha/beta hydrolase family esterase
MKNAILIHGMPTKEEYVAQGNSATMQHWFPSLKEQLEAAGTHVELPEMPEPYSPDYKKWREVFEQYKVDDETLLVGHSCGAGFLLRWLSEKKRKVKKLALVAPWIDIDGRSAPAMFTGFSADLSLPERMDMAMFCSNDDDEEELATFTLLKSQYPGMRVYEFTGRGHFTGEHNRTFPELRDFLLTG